MYLLAKISLFKSFLELRDKCLDKIACTLKLFIRKLEVTDKRKVAHGF